MTNKHIKTANAVIGRNILTPIVGNYKPGYIYGTVKTHKEGNPLRPIISQIPSPIYQTAKQLDNIIKPYIPKKYSIKSRDEFIEILHNSNNAGLVASLDVTSLFTNVPVEDTINIILKNVYENITMSPPPIPKDTLAALLRCCTTSSPFRAPNNKLYYQINGVAMGSPLGPTFSEFYMCDLENRVITDENKPHIYCRYVDDIFVLVRDQQNLIDLKNILERNSVLKFTYEISNNNKMPFLDVLVKNLNDTFETTVYVKSTSAGTCINAESECPERYKVSAVKSFIRRAHKVCSE